jgi:hypothetical protein
VRPPSLSALVADFTGSVKSKCREGLACAVGAYARITPRSSFHSNVFRLQCTAGAMWPCTRWSTSPTGIWLRCRRLPKDLIGFYWPPFEARLSQMVGGAKAQEVAGCVPGQGGGIRSGGTQPMALYASPPHHMRRTGSLWQPLEALHVLL